MASCDPLLRRIKRMATRALRVAIRLAPVGPVDGHYLGRQILRHIGHTGKELTPVACCRAFNPGSALGKARSPEGLWHGVAHLRGLPGAAEQLKAELTARREAEDVGSAPTRGGAGGGGGPGCR
jgi:hypothetical protein